MIPSQNEMFQLVLSAVASLPQFTRRQVKQIVAEKLHLTEQEKNEKTSSGALVYESRASWAVSWLNHAAYIERTKRATYMFRTFC